MKVQDIINSKNSKHSYIRSALWQVRMGKLTRFCELVQWLWFCYLRLIFTRLLALVLALMSLLIVWGESTLFFTTTLSLIPYCLRFIQGEVLIQLYCLCPLGYLVVCTYMPLFELKLKGRYGLYSSNHTDPGNLIWSACFMARLIPAISFNFILLVEVQNTQFRKVMKVVDLVPYLGNDLAEILPMLLIVFCLMNAFNIHTRIMNSIGLTQFTFNEVFDPSRIVEGKSLIDKARMIREKKVREASNYSKRIAGGQAVEDESKSPLKKPLRL